MVRAEQIVNKSHGQAAFQENLSLYISYNSLKLINYLQFLSYKFIFMVYNNISKKERGGLMNYEKLFENLGNNSLITYKEAI